MTWKQSSNPSLASLLLALLTFPGGLAFHGGSSEPMTARISTCLQCFSRWNAIRGDDLEVAAPRVVIEDWHQITHNWVGLLGSHPISHISTCAADRRVYRWNYTWPHPLPHTKCLGCKLCQKFWTMEIRFDSERNFRLNGPCGIWCWNASSSRSPSLFHTYSHRNLLQRTNFLQIITPHQGKTTK